MAEPAGPAESESGLGDSDSVYSDWLPIAPPESEPESETRAKNIADWLEWPQQNTKILNFTVDDFLPAGAERLKYMSLCAGTDSGTHALELIPNDTNVTLAIATLGPRGS